jgi:hypothetical protein
MADPRVPGGDRGRVELPCGETIHAHDIDMGMREVRCDCGDVHAVVVDVHPVSRFVPESIADVLRESIETEDEFPEFDTPHVMGIVMEEFPEAVAVADVSEDGSVGYAMAWVTDFDSRRLHGVVVELLVELMEHAVSHADEGTASEFERRMTEFDVEAFVEEYREKRDFESEVDTPV